MSWKEIRTNFRSLSQLYEALREFLLEQERLLEEARGELAEVEERVEEGKELAERNGELIEVNARLAVDVKNKMGELAEIEGDLDQLYARGFKGEVLEKIVRIDVESGCELLSEVEALRDLDQLKKDLSDCLGEKTRLENVIQELDNKRGKIEDEVVSAKNRLDELQVQTTTYADSVVAVMSFFEEDFSSKDLKALLYGLRALRVQGESQLSISRLLGGLEGLKNLTRLQSSIDEKSSQLDTLNLEIVKAKGELEGFKVLIENFEEVKQAGLDAINSTADVAREKTIESALTFDEGSRNSLAKLDGHIKINMETFASGLEEWNEINQKKETLLKEIQLGETMKAFMESTEYLSTVPANNIIQFLERILLWCKINLREFRAKPSQRVGAGELGLNQFLPYKLTAVVEFLVESLKQYQLEQ